MDDSFAFFKFRKNNDINNTTINDNKNNNTIIMTTQEGQFEANGNGKKKRRPVQSQTTQVLGR